MGKTYTFTFLKAVLRFTHVLQNLSLDRKNVLSCKRELLCMKMFKFSIHSSSFCAYIANIRYSQYMRHVKRSIRGYVYPRYFVLHILCEPAYY